MLIKLSVDNSHPADFTECEPGQVDSVLMLLAKKIEFCGQIMPVVGLSYYIVMPHDDTPHLQIDVTT